MIGLGLNALFIRCRDVFNYNPKSPSQEKHSCKEKHEGALPEDETQLVDHSELRLMSRISNSTTSYINKEMKSCLMSSNGVDVTLISTSDNHKVKVKG